LQSLKKQQVKFSKFSLSASVVDVFKSDFLI
jgi:hypothetical protein